MKPTDFARFPSRAKHVNGYTTCCGVSLFQIGACVPRDYAANTLVSARVKDHSVFAQLGKIVICGPFDKGTLVIVAKITNVAVWLLREPTDR